MVILKMTKNNQDFVLLTKQDPLRQKSQGIKGIVF